MNLLKEGLEQKLVVRTTMTRKLTVDGITTAYPVFKVRLDCLFYNDQNDRIATWMSLYKSQNDGKAPDLTNREEYNEIIEKQKQELLLFSKESPTRIYLKKQVILKVSFKKLL